MSEKFTVSVDITAQDKTGKALQSTERGFKSAFKEIGAGAIRFAGERLASFAAQIPGMVVDLGKLGIQSQAVTQRFERFAGSSGQAAVLLESFNQGTENTVDRMSAMSSAGRLLQMGLVSTGDEMSQVSAIATKLGDQTMGAGDRIADFAALLANQSIPRLDNFGISSGRVRARIDELLKSGQALDREQAFKMAVMEEGSKSLIRLGDTSDTAAHKLAVLQAAGQDAKVGFGELLIAMVDTVGGVDDLAARIRGLPAAFAQATAVVNATTEALNELKTKGFLVNPIEVFNESLKRSAIAMMDVKHVSEIERYAHLDVAQAVEDEGRALDFSVGAMEEYNDVALRSEVAQDRAARASDRFSEQLRQQAETAMDTAEAQLGLAGQYTDFHEDIAKAAEDSTERRADIEQKHQDALVDIAKKGRSSRIKVDTLGLQFDVRIAKGRLAQLIARQEEFNEDTTDLERARTERSILSLGEELHEKTTILQTAQDGFVTMKGQNVNKLLAEEDRQYQTSVAKLEESLAEQETSQRKSLGRMVLTHFNAWVDMNLAADGFTTEESQFVTDMRNEISTEYGLITEMAVQQMKAQERRWEIAMAAMTGDAASFFLFFMREFNALPSEKIIRIRKELAEPGDDILGGPDPDPDPDPDLGLAAGGSFLVGEQGVEKVTIQPLGGNTYNDTFNIFDTGAMSAVQDQRRRERRREFERTM